MAKGQIVKISLMLGGDIRQKIIKEVTVPEMRVLDYLHGHGSVEVLEVLREVEIKPKDERIRLAHTYGANVVMKQLYPGVIPTMEMVVEGMPTPKKPRTKAKPKAEEPAAEVFDTAEVEDELANPVPAE